MYRCVSFRDGATRRFWVGVSKCLECVTGVLGACVRTVIDQKVRVHPSLLAPLLSSLPTSLCEAGALFCPLRNIRPGDCLAHSRHCLLSEGRCK